MQAMPNATPIAPSSPDAPELLQKLCAPHQLSGRLADRFGRKNLFIIGQGFLIARMQLAPIFLDAMRIKRVGITTAEGSPSGHGASPR